jgi:hypothetical protein
MNKKTLTMLISVALVLFVLVKILADQLCTPTSHSAVADAVSSAVSGPSSAQKPNAPDPLSWEPVLRWVFTLVSKACSR